MPACGGRGRTRDGRSFGTARTAASDRSEEFADRARVSEDAGAEPCLCAAHHPWEKGCVENLSELIRKYFPKGSDPSLVTEADVQGGVR